MAGNIKGITVEIGGNTTGLDKALQDANAQSRDLQKELRAVQKQLDLDPTNVEMLAQKQKLLGKAVEDAASKLKSLKDAQEQVEQKFKSGKIGEEAYRDFQREVVAAQNALNGAKKAVNDFGDDSVNAGKDVYKLGKEVKDTGDKTEDTGERFKTFGSVVAGVGAVVAATTAAIGAAAVGAVNELTDMSREAAVYADDMATLSAQTGVSTDSLQAYNYAAELVDVSLDTLTGSMAKQIKSMTSAQQGTKNTIEAYEALGVSITDANGNMRDGEVVYWEVIDALGAVQNETERDSLAMTLLGKSAQDLNPLIKTGSAALKDLTDEAYEAGAVMSKDTLDGLLAVSDNMERLNSSVAAAKNNVGTLAAGALSAYYGGAAEIVQDFNKIVTAAANGDDISGALIQEFTDSITGTVEAVAAEIPTIINIVMLVLGAVISAIQEALPALVQTLITYIPQILGVITSILPLLLNTLGSIFIALVSGLVATMPELMQTVTTILLSLVGGIIEMLPEIVSVGVSIILSLADGISEALPELIPAVVDAVITIAEGIIDNLPKILQAALSIIQALAKGILDALPRLIAALPKIILSIVDFLLKAIPAIIQTGITLITSLVAALPEIISAIVAAVPEIIEGIITAVLSAIPMIIDAGMSLLVSLIQALPQIIIQIVNAIPDIIDGIIDALIGAIPQLIEAGITLFIAIVKNMPAILAGISKAVPQIINGIIEAITGSIGKISDVGRQLIEGLWNGIKDAGAWLWDKISVFFDGVVDKIKSFFGIASPSKLFRDEIGAYLAEGIGEGFTDQMGNVAEDMQDAIPTEFDTAINAAHTYTYAGEGTNTFDVTIPLAIDGKTITRVVSRIQYNQSTGRARVVGVSS